MGKKVEREICASTGKVMFPRKVEARTVANFRMAKGAEYLRPYECQHCGQWHLTSKRDRNESRRPEKV